MGPENTLILIDGRRVSARDSVRMGVAGERNSRADTHWVPAEAVERIEVLRGPTAARSGSGAAGGVVNIITKKPTGDLTGSMTLYGLVPENGDEGGSQRGLYPQRAAVAGPVVRSVWQPQQDRCRRVVLHALFTRPQAFNRDVAVDPSLWWEQGQILEEERALLARKALAAPAWLLLITGSGAGEEGARQPQPGAEPRRSQAMRAACQALPADAPACMVKRVQALPGLRARQQTLPGLAHGQTLGASLRAAMDFAGAPSP